MEADVNEDSDIWIDLITQDHSKFAELLTQYELPKLGRLRIMNVASNMNIFEDLMLKSLKSSVKQLYITSSDLNHFPIDKTFNILSRIKDSVTQELWLGHFTMTIEQMNTLIQKKIDLSGPEKYKLEHISFEGCSGSVKNQFLIDFVKSSIECQLSLSLKDINVFSTEINSEKVAGELSEIDSGLKVINNGCSPNYVQKNIQY